MNTHKNAPLTPRGREVMVRSVSEGGLSKAAAARQFNTTPKTVAKWVERFRTEGVDGLRDRSSRPLSLPSQTAPATCAVVEALRRQRHTGKQIAAEVGVSPATDKQDASLRRSVISVHVRIEIGWRRWKHFLNPVDRGGANVHRRRACNRSDARAGGTAHPCEGRVQSCVRSA